MHKKVLWNQTEWAERTKMLDATERGVLADLRNLMLLNSSTPSPVGKVSSTLDTWAVIMRMSTESVRKVFVGLEAAGVIRIYPKPGQIESGTTQFLVDVTW